MSWGLLLIIPLIWASLLAAFWPVVKKAWQEQVLRCPVLVIESDDWGPGPAHHAPALERLIEVLAACRDQSGRRPVMTLGICLSVPDAETIRSNGQQAYAALALDDPRFAGIRAAIDKGRKKGVFAPHLHGMAHYWPPSLMRAAGEDAAVRAWLTSKASLETETLPSHLQSRWTDASVLPSRPLSDEEAGAAAREEVEAFQGLFGVPPKVVVPPTFVWNERVERAWAAAGVRCVVTPGRRYTGRDGAGLPAWDGSEQYNGEPCAGEMIYLVRDRYFEPSLGHTAGRALRALREKTAEGRPCLLETHRFNFTGPGAPRALAELSSLLQVALADYPTLRFVASEELAEQYRSRGDWIERRLRVRLAAWAARMLAVPRFAKLARLTGFTVGLLLLRVRPRPGSFSCSLLPLMGLFRRP